MTETPTDQFFLYPSMVVSLQRSSSNQCIQDRLDLLSRVDPKRKRTQRAAGAPCHPRGKFWASAGPHIELQIGASPAEARPPREREKLSPKDPTSIPDPPVSKDPLRCLNDEN